MPFGRQLRGQRLADLAGRQVNRAASRRAIVAQRGGLRFEGLVAGQASHVSTRRSAPSVRSRRATDVAVWRDS